MTETNTSAVLEALPKLSIQETLSVTTEILLPKLAKGSIIR